jgi:hypothetical protein
VSKRGTPERTKKALQEAIAAVEEALAAGLVVLEPGVAPDAERESRRELLEFKSNLERMLHDVSRTSIEKGEQYAPISPLGRIRADSWFLGLSVGEAILNAEQEYEAFTRREGYLAF